MRVIGIVAEFNPFHSGHEYLIAKARKLSGDPRAIVMPIISGPFTQRGLPAILPSHVRARQALKSGADVVLELPFTFACAPSSRFAYGAVAALLSTGVLTDLAFGIDCERPEDLEELSKIDFESIPEYTSSLKDSLSSGLSYAAARAAAINAASSVALDPRDYSQTLKSPNSILALDYLTALAKLDRKHRINVMMIPRVGEGYNSSKISATSFASASAIRRTLINSCAPDYSQSAMASALCNLIPDSSLAVMLGEYSRKEFAIPNYGAYIRSCLMRLNTCDASKIAYMGDGLCGYLRNFTDALKPGDLPTNDYGTEIFEQKVSTRHFTLTRIERALASLAAGQTEADLACDTPQYVRILGFNREGRYCLKIMRKCARVPLISNPSDALELYSSNENLKRMFELDMRASSAYWELAGRDMLHEWELPPVMI